MTSDKNKKLTQIQKETLLAFYSLFGNEILEQAKALLDAKESDDISDMLDEVNGY